MKPLLHVLVLLRQIAIAKYSLCPCSHSAPDCFFQALLAIELLSRLWAVIKQHKTNHVTSLLWQVDSHHLNSASLKWIQNTLYRPSVFLCPRLVIFLAQEWMYEHPFQLFGLKISEELNLFSKQLWWSKRP